MLLRSLVLSTTLLLTVACSNDKESDTQSSTQAITPKKYSTMDFTYYDKSYGMKRYQLNLITGNLIGSWEHIDKVDNADRRMAAQSKKTIRSRSLEGLKVAVLDLNKQLANVDKSRCGELQNTSNSYVYLTSSNAEAKILILEQQDLRNSCSDEYVADGTFAILLNLFEKALPEPQNDAFAQVKDPPVFP